MGAVVTHLYCIYIGFACSPVLMRAFGTVTEGIHFWRLHTVESSTCSAAEDTVLFKAPDSLKTPNG